MTPTDEARKRAEEKILEEYATLWDEHKNLEENRLHYRKVAVKYFLLCEEKDKRLGEIAENAKLLQSYVGEKFFLNYPAGGQMILDILRLAKGEQP